MDLSARKVRQDLSADSLFRLIRCRLDRVADPRADQVGITLGDALMSAFAMFSLKDPSLLAFGDDAFETVIPDLSQFEQAVNDRVPITLHSPTSYASSIARSFFDELEARCRTRAA